MTTLFEDLTRCLSGVEDWSDDTAEEHCQHEGETYGSCGHEDDCPPGCEAEYNLGF